MAEKDAKKQQGDLAGKLMTDVLSVLQNPGALPPLTPPKEGPGLSVGNFTPELKMPALPSAPEPPPDLSTGTKIGRAAAVFLAGMSNPELAGMLVRQFAQQDQLAAERVQQDFANKMALVQAGRQEVTFQAEQADIEAGKKQTAEDRAFAKQRAATEDAKFRIQTAIDALNLVERQKEAEMQAGDPTSSAYQLMRLEMDQIEFMRQSFENQLKDLAPEVPANLAKDYMAQRNILGGETFDKLMLAGKPTYEAALEVLEGKGRSRVAEAKAAFRSAPAYIEFKKKLSPMGQFLADQLIGTAPDPGSGDRGDPVGNAEAAVALSQETTADGQNALVAAMGNLAKQYVAEGRFPTVQEAEEQMAEWYHKGLSPAEMQANLPAPGAFKKSSLLAPKTLQEGEFKGLKRRFFRTQEESAEFYKRHPKAVERQRGR